MFDKKEVKEIHVVVDDHNLVAVVEAVGEKLKVQSHELAIKIQQDNEAREGYILKLKQEQTSTDIAVLNGRINDFYGSIHSLNERMAELYRIINNIQEEVFKDKFKKERAKARGKKKR